ncbi:MAG: winged helix-turn-helix transcriptional regulator [Coriobacteriales bacterium]|nr:winged helix-turn-helix transcriptional regulator [Coriobacteriales bacterium]
MLVKKKLIIQDAIVWASAINVRGATHAIMDWYHNPGKFPDEYTPQDFIEGRGRTIRRNPLLAETMYYSKDIESFGTGLKKIAMECVAAGVRYAFDCGSVGFTAIFYRPELAKDDATVSVTSLGTSVTDKVTEAVSEKVTEEDRAVLSLIAEKPGITQNQMAGSLGVSRKTIAKRIKSLKDKKQIKRIGSDTKGYWEIIS